MKNIKVVFTTLLLSCVLYGCHHDKVHTEQENAQQYTAYNARYELFVECSPLVVGSEAQLVAHITHLENFKPLDSTLVILSLQVGSHIQNDTVSIPETAGIYRFHFTPRFAGKGNINIAIQGDNDDPLTISAVTIFPDSTAMQKAHLGEPHVTGANNVSFSKEFSWKVDFATAVIQPVPFGAVIKTTAQILPSQGDEREVCAKISGMVIFNNPTLTEGTAVKAGTHLFTIDNAGMAENNMSVRFQEAAANYSAAKAEYERKSQLIEDKIVSQAELTRCHTTYVNAKALYDNLRANFSRQGQSVSSPISGYVNRITVRNGAYIAAGQPIMTVSQNKDYVLRAELSPRYYAQLGNIQDANIQLSGQQKVYSLKELDGRLISYGKNSDLDNPLIPVTFQIRNTGELLSGSFVTLYLRTQSDSSSLVVPNSGIVEELGNHFVFVQITPETFEKRPVSLGVTDGISTIITNGLKAGERVVTRGAIMVKLAQSSGKMDPHNGHIH
jgi:RND family efflux transporter MFP subunit